MYQGGLKIREEEEEEEKKQRIQQNKIN